MGVGAEPRPGEIRVAIKKDIGGVFSTWANEQLKAGDRLDVTAQLAAEQPRRFGFGAEVDTVEGASLSAFFAWCTREKIIAANPVTGVRVPRSSAVRTGQPAVPPTHCSTAAPSCTR